MPEKVDIFLGFDPGGKGEETPRFGWSICQGGPDKLRLLCSGTARFAMEVIVRVRQKLPRDGRVRASGIDAPLLWPISVWDRQVDKTIRQALRNKGDETTSVQHINSLAGAGLAQGILLAELLYQIPKLRSPITEAHPKALLSLLEIPRSDLGDLVGCVGNIQGPDKEHREDATLAAYAAWSMHHRRQGWKDLLEDEKHEPFSPFPREMDIGYWMPIP